MRVGKTKRQLERPKLAQLDLYGRSRLLHKMGGMSGISERLSGQLAIASHVFKDAESCDIGFFRNSAKQDFEKKAEQATKDDRHKAGKISYKAYTQTKGAEK